MKLKLVLALLLGTVVGAGAVFGVFYVREKRRYDAYVEHMASYEATEYEPALFEESELHALNLVTPTGERQPLSRGSDGRVILINFWASWCKPCLDEFDAFEELYSQTKDRVDFYFLTDEPLETIEALTRRHELPFYSYGSDSLLPAYMRAPELPRTYILRDGRIVYEHRGPAPWGGAKARAFLDSVADVAEVP